MPAAAAASASRCVPGPKVASFAPTVKIAVVSGYGAFDAMMFAGFTAS